MKRVLLFAAAFVFAGGTAMAGDIYANLYGNTVTITGSDGAKLTTYVNQDLTWENHMSGSTTAKGTYYWKDATTACFTRVDPAPKSPDQATVCLPNQTAHNVGETWTVSGADGKPVTITLTAGR